VDTSQRRDTSDQICTYYAHLLDVCERLVDSTFADANVGCGYHDGWTPYTYGATSTTLRFTLRSEKDPFLVALSQTSGSLDFGNTQAQNATIGGILLGVGGCLFIPCFVGIFLMASQLCDNSQTDTLASYDDNTNSPEPAPYAMSTSSGTAGMVPNQSAPGYSDNNFNDVTKLEVDPSPPPISVAPGITPLPPNWAATKDPNSGDVYYYNSDTNETTWERPTY